MTGKVVLPSTMVRPGLPDWAVFGDGPHRGNLISSIFLDEKDLESHNVRLNEKYRLMEVEQRADLFACGDASTLVVAFGTPARMAKGAVEALRSEGLPVGLFRPLTLWPFPIASLRAILPNVKKILVVEASNGQLEDELRLALSKAGLAAPPIESVRHFGGVLPQSKEIAAAVRSHAEVAA
jgi:pyruvate/2-oxoacid:ferredoxin oxidoreductase alpha subunit